MLEELQTLGHALAVAAFRHRVLANDLANSATPGFRAQDVVPFGEALASALPLLQADPRHVGAPSPDGDGLGVLVVTTSLLASPGGSGVDPDATTAAIAGAASCPSAPAPPPWARWATGWRSWPSSRTPLPRAGSTTPRTRWPMRRGTSRAAPPRPSWSSWTSWTQPATTRRTSRPCRRPRPWSNRSE